MADDVPELAQGWSALTDLIGESPPMVALRQQVGRLLLREPVGGRLRLPPFLIEGETGTGKGLLARAIHRASLRAAEPFVDVDCASIPETLLEAELFGFERGAFTDARQAKAGLFQTAQGGTIFLDEVGLLPRPLQAKLLKAVEEREVRRLGSTRSEPVDVRILAATNEDLAGATREGRFREDLYHRLATVTLRMPTLRQRGPDILLLAERLLAKASADYGLPPKVFSPEAQAAMLAYPWPGNVRELGNMIERVVLLSENPIVTVDLLAFPPAMAGASKSLASAAPMPVLRTSVESFERDRVLDALGQANGNLSLAAERLGMPRNTLRYRMVKLGIPLDGLRANGRPAQWKPTEILGGGSAKATSQPARSAIRWHLRPVTMLRVSLRPLADPEWPASMGRVLDSLVEKLRSFGGEIEEVNGGEVLAAFGPEPIEDAVGRAANAALALHKAVEPESSGDSPAFGMRIGIHACPALVGRVSGSPRLHEESRRQVGALLGRLLEGDKANAILVSPRTVVMLRGRFELEGPGQRGEAGEAGYRLLGRQRSRGEPSVRPLAPFINRKRELSTLLEVLAQVRAGNGQVVGIIGEHGVGKTRLVHEFRRSLEGQPVVYREGRAVAYGRALPYLPVLDVLSQTYGVTDADNPATVETKIRQGLRDVGVAPDEWAPHVLTLFGLEGAPELPAGLTPEALRIRVFEILRRLAIEPSTRQPLIIVVEDLQWLGKGSEEFMQYLMDSLPGSRILLLTTYRPGYRPPWIDRSYTTQIPLQPLSRGESLALVRSVLPGRVLPEAVIQAILRKAQGNPFFLEELAAAVSQDEELVSGTRVPETIQATLMARIEQLPEGPRRLIQATAVLGREVPRRFLAAVAGDMKDFQSHLQELKRLEFLVERVIESESVFAFKHALTQEVAYESLHQQEREALHARAGGTLERLYEDRLGEVVDRLAHHYSRAEQPAKAVRYLTRLAEKAARSYALAEALHALQEGVTHAERLPAGRDRERLVLDLVVRQTLPLAQLGRSDDARDLLLRYKKRLEQLWDASLAASFYLALASAYDQLGDPQLAERWTARAAREADQCGDRTTLGKSHYGLSFAAFWSGQFREGTAHGLKAVGLLERSRERCWLGESNWLLGMNYIGLGDFDRGLEAERRVAAIGRETGDARLLSYAAWTTGWIHSLRGDWEAAIAACHRGLDCAPDPFASVMAAGWLGEAYLEKGDAFPAIALLEQATRQWKAFKFRQLEGLVSVWLGEALLLIGQAARARTAATRGLVLTRETGFRLGRACAERVLGRIARARGAFEEAAQHLHEARQEFDAIGARYELARAEFELALLAQVIGTPEVAPPHLAEARRLFTDLRVPKYVERADELSRQLLGHALEAPRP